MQKIKAVLDTNVIISGLFWPGDSARCLQALARREFFAVVSPGIMSEYRGLVAEFQEKHGRVEPMHFLDWLQDTAEEVDPLPMGKLSRDVNDNIFVGCALAAKASYIITRDRDLLALGKPFGVEILEPRAFLRKI